MQQKKIGRYEIQELLGAGGMGSVYRAFDPDSNRDVALKVINLNALRRTSHEKRNETLKRFRHEVRVIAQLQQVAIVPLFDSGDDNGTPYMVMPLMKGGSLEARLLDKDDNPLPLPLAEIERILAWIAPALDKMHAQNIVHRDLKPANILFDEDNYAYIADFGIAKLTEGSVTFNTGTIGTPAYMSPEQADDQKKVDGRSDVYSLGAMLYKMLTGERPYHQVHPAILPYYHINEPPPRLDELRSDLHPSWQTIIDKAMAKKREERYQTASELSAAVSELLRDEAEWEAGKNKIPYRIKRDRSSEKVDHGTEHEQTTIHEPLQSSLEKKKQKYQTELQKLHQEAEETRRRVEQEKQERETELERLRKEAEKQAELEKARKEVEEARRQAEEEKRRHQAELEWLRPMKPLSPTNPLDHLRLLWWTLITPQQLMRYKEQKKEFEIIEKIGNFLINTLVWLPLLFFTLALGLGTLPLHPDAFSAMTYLWISGGLLVLWLLSGWFTLINSYNDLEFLFTSFFVAVVMALVAPAVLSFKVVAIVAVIVSFEVVASVGIVIAEKLFYDQETDEVILKFRFSMMFGFMVGVGLAMIGGVVGFIAGIIAGGIAAISSLFTSGAILGILQWNGVDPLRQAAFAALVAANAFLLWFCFFGGWRAFA